MFFVHMIHSNVHLDLVFWKVLGANMARCTKDDMTQQRVRNQREHIFFSKKPNETWINILSWQFFL